MQQKHNSSQHWESGRFKDLKKVLDEKRSTNIDYLAISHEPVHPAQDLAADNFLGQIIEMIFNFEPHGSPVYVSIYVRYTI